MKNLRTGTAKFDTIRAKDANGLSLQDDGGNGIFIKDGGNVGIGTKNAFCKLHVINGDEGALTIDGSTAYESGRFTSTAAGRSISLLSSAATVSNYIGSLDTNHSLRFFTTKQSDASRNTHMTITQSGNVGIGTTNPACKVHISGTDAGLGAQLRLENTTASTGETFRLNSGNNGLLNINSVTAGNMMTFKGSNGNVGIGTTGPRGVLHVVSDVQNNSLQDYGIAAFENTNLEGLSIGYNTDNNFTYLWSREVGVGSRGLHLNGSIFVDNYGGNVGIGITDPSEELSILGNIKIVKNLTGSPANGDILGSIAFEGVNSVNTNFQAEAKIEAIAEEAHGPGTAATGLQFYTKKTGTGPGSQASPSMRIDSAGNVGIGTTNPVYNLHIADATQPNLLIQRTTPDGNVSGLTLNSVGGTGINNRTGDISLMIVDNAGDSEPVLRFSTTNGASPTKHTMSITKGNVGIGTTNPAVKLEVVNSESANIAQFSSKSSNLGGYILIKGSSEAGSAGDLFIGNGRPLVTGSSDASAAIRASTELLFSIAAVERMRITSGGNVGIGTTNPTAKLDVDGAVHLGGGLNVSSDNTHGYASTGGWNYVFRDAVGIKDPNSLSFPSPVDAVMTVGRMTSGISIYCNGSVYGNSSVLTSDDRVKHNEQAIVGAIETLGKLAPKKYIKTTEMYEADHNFGLDADGNPVDENGDPVEHSIEAGVIAQQVLEVPELAFMVSPEGVDEDGNVTSPHGLNYNSLFTYAIAAIQEQQQIIEDLKSQNASLESRISALES